MEYISTRNNKKAFSFKDVFLRGLAPDGGLFIPKKLPFFSKNKLNKLKKLSYNSLAEKIRLMLRSVVELKCNITLLIPKNEKLIYFLLQLFTLKPNPQRLYLENQTYF